MNQPTADDRSTASLVHQRWQSHRVVLRLAGQVARRGLWVSATCVVHVPGGEPVRPLAVVAGGDPPADGVLTEPPLLVIDTAVDGRTPRWWRQLGVPTAWQLHDDRIDVADVHGERQLPLPGTVHDPGLGVELRWPLSVASSMARPP